MDNQNTYAGSGDSGGNGSSADTRTLPVQSGSNRSSGSGGATYSGQINSTQGKSGTGEKAGDKVEDVVQQVKEGAGEVAQTVRAQAGSQLASQKDRASDAPGGVAQAIRQTGTHLHQSDQLMGAQYADKAAEKIEQLSTYLRQSDMREITVGVERFARRQPALFLGGAFLLGVLGARFLKSSGQQGQDSGYDYDRSGGYDRGYGQSYGSGYSSGYSSDNSPYNASRSMSTNQSTGYDYSASAEDDAPGTTPREYTWTGSSLEES